MQATRNAPAAIPAEGRRIRYAQAKTATARTAISAIWIWLPSEELLTKRRRSCTRVTMCTLSSTQRRRITTVISHSMSIHKEGRIAPTTSKKLWRMRSSKQAFRLWIFERRGLEDSEIVLSLWFLILPSRAGARLSVLSEGLYLLLQRVYTLY